MNRLEVDGLPCASHEVWGGVLSAVAALQYGHSLGRGVGRWVHVGAIKHHWQDHAGTS